MTLDNRSTLTEIEMYLCTWPDLTLNLKSRGSQLMILSLGGTEQSEPEFLHHVALHKRKKRTYVCSLFPSTLTLLQNSSLGCTLQFPFFIRHEYMTTLFPQLCPFFAHRTN